MFFDGDRIIAVREMIMADDAEGRKKALAKLLPMQRGDFEELFRIMVGLPVTIRLLDPPLHEFLPKTDAEFDELAALTGQTVSEIRQRTHALEVQLDARETGIPNMDLVACASSLEQKARDRISAERGLEHEIKVFIDSAFKQPFTLLPCDAVRLGG